MKYRELSIRRQTDIGVTLSLFDIQWETKTEWLHCWFVSYWKSPRVRATSVNFNRRLTQSAVIPTRKIKLLLEQDGKFFYSLFVIYIWSIISDLFYSFNVLTWMELYMNILLFDEYELLAIELTANCRLKLIGVGRSDSFILWSKLPSNKILKNI